MPDLFALEATLWPAKCYNSPYSIIEHSELQEKVQ